MINIIKSDITSKKRVLNAFNRIRTDRVPINYMANISVHNKLAKHLGISNSLDTVMDYLGVDFKELMPQYIGKKIFADIPGRKVDPLWGHVTRWIGNNFGGYWDYCDFPLIGKSEEEIANWPIPNADDFDYNELLERCKQHKDKAIHLGNPGLSDIINSVGMLRNMENILLDLALGTPGVLHYIDRRINFQAKLVERVLDRCGKYISFIWIGEDLGTQTSPLISLSMFRKQIRPRHQRVIDVAKKYNKPVMIHSCGSSSWVFDDFYEMGISMVDTLQPEAKNMDPEYLINNFGDKLSFHGGISTARLVDLTEQEVREEVTYVINTMKKYNGYCLAPTHAIQDNTPVENIVAMYETAHVRGMYQ